VNVARPSPGGGIVLSQAPPTQPISLVDFPEPEWDRAGSLPLRPVLEDGVDIVNANVMELGDSNTVRQVLGKDKVARGLLQFSPWDSSLAARCDL
jgi:hypothetical protein